MAGVGVLLVFISLIALFGERANAAEKVRIDLFVMSRCPDAGVCEKAYAPVIDQVGSIVDLNVNYIASIDDHSTPPFSCMHGPAECNGNLQQICAKSLFPTNYTWWNFIQCQDVSQYNIPANGPTCASKNGMSYAQIQSCATTETGYQLMRESIEFTNARKIRSSCTIWINNEHYCVHDGGWKNCKSHQTATIVRDICQLYQGTDKPPACKHLWRQ